MGSAVSAIAPILSGPLGSTVAGTLAKVLTGAPKAPASSPAPAAPAAAPAPEAPAPVESSAPEAGEAPVVDTEAARIRAAKRRKAASDRNLFDLNDPTQNSAVLTKSLLGE